LSAIFKEEIMKARALLLMAIGCLALFGAILLSGAPADAATIVALGASNTYGKGVARNQAYPAQLEAILRAKGLAFTW
jgi:acyl-CoA thioesterase-1